MNLLAFADLHDVNRTEIKSILKEVKYDLVLLLGDIDKDTLKFIKDNSLSKIIGVEGNHDLLNTLNDIGIENIHLNTYKHDDFVFGGFNGSVDYKKSHNYHLYSQLECFALLDDFEPVDVFISHNSPFEINDKPDIAHNGFKGINNYIEIFKPKLHIHGHQHLNHINCDSYPDTTIISIYGIALINTDDETVQFFNN